MLDPAQSIAYDSWANARVLHHLAADPHPPSAPLGLLAHLLASIEVWLTRVGGRSSSGMEIWPSWSIPECEESYERSQAELAKVVLDLASAGLDREISYESQHGKAYVTAVGDILTHLAVHGAYHRGQIATLLRQAGRTPVNTDYITFVREGSLPQWQGE